MFDYQKVIVQDGKSVSWDENAPLNKTLLGRLSLRDVVDEAKYNASAILAYRSSVTVDGSQ